jgi:hypothetical protein
LFAGGERSGENENGRKGKSGRAFCILFQWKKKFFGIIFQNFPTVIYAMELKNNEEVEKWNRTKN